MKRKHIDCAREVRLWIGQVIVPALIGVGALNKMYPDLKHKVKSRFDSVKTKIKNVFE